MMGILIMNVVIDKFMFMVKSSYAMDSEKKLRNEQNRSSGISILFVENFYDIIKFLRVKNRQRKFRTDIWNNCCSLYMCYISF